MHAAFRTFIDSVEPLIRRLTEPAEIVDGVEAPLRRLINEQDWLDDPYRRAIPTKPYAQYLLYRPPDLAFSVVSFVWNPGQGSPIHDHCTWGVIGQLEGEEEEGRFLVTKNGIERSSLVICRTGEVSHVYPPSRDIHQIVNRTAIPTISIHIYGGDIGSQERHIFDPQSGEMRPFISGYDNL